MRQNSAKTVAKMHETQATGSRRSLEMTTNFKFNILLKEPLNTLKIDKSKSENSQND